MKRFLTLALGISLLGGSLPVFAGSPAPSHKAPKRKGKKIKTRKGSSGSKARKPKSR